MPKGPFRIDLMTAGVVNINEATNIEFHFNARFGKCICLITLEDLYCHAKDHALVDSEVGRSQIVLNNLVDGKWQSEKRYRIFPFEKDRPAQLLILIDQSVIKVIKKL